MYSLKLEAIGDNHSLAKSAMRKAAIAAGYPREMIGPDTSRPWVARITGGHSKYRLARQFVKGQKDYSEANSVGSRGIHYYYALSNGMYEVFHRTSWTRSRRYFIFVDGDDAFKVTAEEVDEWLNTAPENWDLGWMSSRRLASESPGPSTTSPEST